MIHYIKTTSEQHVYQALEQAGACTRVYDPTDPANQAPSDTTDTWAPSGSFDWVLDDGVELDMIGVIHVQKHDLDLDSDDNPQFEVTTHTGLSGETIETITNKLKMKLLTIEDTETKQQIPDMVPVRMIMPGDVDQPASEPVFEKQLTQPAQPATHWTTQDELDLLLPAGVSIGDVKTPAVGAVYDMVQIESAAPAIYHDLTDSLSSPVVYHANIRGITGTQASMLPTIDAPSKPTRIWWS